jgi:hypothetical protein
MAYIREREFLPSATGKNNLPAQESDAYSAIPKDSQRIPIS